MASIYKDMLNPKYKITHIAMGLMVIVGLLSCGGGGGSAGSAGSTGGSGSGSGGGSNTANGSVVLSLVDTTGASKNTLSPGSPLVAKATVTSATGTPVKDAVVTFTVGSAIAVLSPTGGTALTDATGVAQVGVEAGVGAGAAEITASVTIGTAAVTSKAAFSVGASPSATPAAINFVKASPTDKSIVIKGAGGNGRTEVAVLTFSVVDSSNSGIANTKVNFTTLSNQPVTLVNLSGTTGQNGEVSVTINSGLLPTTVRVIATVDGTIISALSDSLTVTTGQPIQAAFSLSVDTPNISGWNHDDETANITILMADASGNPVADGTPVVFQTDSGAVGSSSSGGCLTVNGKCSVVFRSQNPRYGLNNTAGKIPGVATITASSTSGTTTLTAQTFVVMSSDDPIFSYNGAKIPSGYTFNQATCAVLFLDLELSDVNGNALPSGTTIGVGATTDVAVGTINPAIVPKSYGPTTHTVPLTVDQIKCAAGGSHTADFTLNVATPKGTNAAYRFHIAYP